MANLAALDLSGPKGRLWGVYFYWYLTYTLLQKGGDLE